jgi:hypothetical protein
VFIVVLVAMGLTVYFFYPETRGYTLEHMAVIFDGDDTASSSEETTARASSVASISEKKNNIMTAHEENIRQSS